MARKQRSNEKAHRNYDVGYGRPPKQFRFQPGQSGNPSGINRKTSSIAADLREPLIRALYSRVEAFVNGDRQALRDVILLTEHLGIDLTAGQGKRTDTDVIFRTEAELRKALLDRGIPERLLPPIDEAGPEPPPDPAVPPDVEDEPNQ